ncbi:MAG: Crp/Fnr family transcriptional regulator [Ezakiella sp.]|nr:Crp/Fnr family transcriptional regulator [Ezakiella sp.]MDD7761415.1 Crp/Fnr family transcriptional regulator [Bacillota bacterium]MDY3946494.1 Crp/Fnr family transcriptional regulator [Ezakiella sp.]
MAKLNNDIIKNTTLLSDLREEDIDKIKSELRLKTFERGEYIFRSGDAAELMYIIKSGAMKISMDLSDGREQILYIYKEEDFVGGLNLITNDEYVYNGIALTDTEVLIISKSAFYNTLLDNKSFLRGLLVESYERIRKSEQLIDRLCVINGDMKVAKGIINLIDTHGAKNEKGNWVITPHLNRTEFGSFTGLTRETLTRKLAYFQEMGYVRLLPKGAIEIIDLDSLNDLTV